MKANRREQARKRLKAKRVKHNYGKRKQIPGISKSWKKLLSDKILGKLGK